MEISWTIYENTWFLRCKRYENKNWLMQNHIRALFTLPNIAKKTAGQLREMLDSITQHLRCSNSLVQKIEHRDSREQQVWCNHSQIMGDRRVRKRLAVPRRYENLFGEKGWHARYAEICKNGKELEEYMRHAKVHKQDLRHCRVFLLSLQWVLLNQ